MLSYNTLPNFYSVDKSIYNYHLKRPFSGGNKLQTNKQDSAMCCDAITCYCGGGTSINVSS